MGARYSDRLIAMDDVLALGLNRAVDLLAKKLASVPHDRTAPPETRSWSPLRKGRFGPYVQHGKTVANLPRGVAMEGHIAGSGGHAC